MKDSTADLLEMRMDDMREALEETYQCVGCEEKDCRDCEISRLRREALGDE